MATKANGSARVIDLAIWKLIKGVNKAVANINDKIAPALIKEDIDLTNQKAVDEFLLKLDGTKNKCTRL